MGIFARALRRLGRAPAPPAPAPELRRRGAPVWADFGAGPITSAGSTVNARIAENVSAVVACVSAIAGPISSVPARVYRAVPGGREEVDSHPVARLIRAPNARQTWPDWLQFTLGQALLHGNSISVIERDGAGRPVALHPVPWQSVQTQLLASGRIAFDTMSAMFPWSSTGTPLQRVFADECFWLKQRSDDSYVGRSVLARAPAVLKAALGIQTFTSTLWDNAAIPSGVLKHPGVLSKEAKEYITESFSRFTGAHQAGKVPILEEGLNFEASGMTPEDSQVLESRRFTNAEIARLFSVSPLLIGELEHGSFSNAETAGRWHASLCLAPHCRSIEAEFQRSVFGEDSDCSLMIDLSGLQRGDELAATQAAVLCVNAGLITANEWRQQNGWNVHPDGNTLHRMPGAPDATATTAPPAGPGEPGAGSGPP